MLQDLYMEGTVMNVLGFLYVQLHIFYVNLWNEEALWWGYNPALFLVGALMYFLVLNIFLLVLLLYILWNMKSF